MRPRPEIIRGNTYNIETGSGQLYVTLNNDPADGKLFECFVTIGKSGGFVSSFTEAIGRLISLCLRSGVDPKDIAKQLIGIRGPRMTFWRQKPIWSVPDAIGRAIMIHTKIDEKTLEKVEDDPTQDGSQSVVVDEEEIPRE